MQLHHLCSLVALAATTAGCRPSEHATVFDYPETTRGDVVENYHGAAVPDPYRWMEDLDSPDVAAWIRAENAVAEPYLASLPLRSRFGNRLTELWNYARVGVPEPAGGQIFYARNAGLQRQSPIYRRARPDAEPVMVIDPNVISEDGSVSLAQWSPSPDGQLLAYGLSEGGADWRTVRVRDVATGRDLADEVRWMRFSEISWTKDGRGFFYARYPEPPAGRVLEAALANQAIYYHRIGTAQTADTLIYERRDLPAWLVGGEVTEDGRYLLVTMAAGADNRNRLYYADLGDPLAPNLKARVRPVVEADDAEYAPIGSRGSTVFLRTDKDAPTRRIVAVDLRSPAPSAWVPIVPERPEAIEEAEVIGGRIVVHYLIDVQSRLLLFGLDGQAQGEIALPSAGAVGEIRGREEAPDVWYSFSAPLVPLTVFRFDPTAQQSAAFEPPQVPFDASGFQTTAHFAVSKDGTRVPFFLTAQKDLPRDGRNPTMLFAYGGFSISTLPTYRQDIPAWVERGGVWVTAALRGGAEYGETWHQAGMLEKKQNVFDDFIAVAEHLVRESYASPATLGIMGGSNGGLLVGAVMQQRPDLFGAALPAVGVMDMLRYDAFTGGRLWVTEYGSSSNPDQFPFLMKYSPVHNAKPACYPATLITTADHDDRVVPSHSFKFAAVMQEAQICNKPVLIRVEVAGSHGYRPTDKLIAERADQWAFAAAHLGMQ